jgi:pSer/pThr/pTyr-binding forkhead associated (FHA) protein
MTPTSQLFWLETAAGECVPIRGHISLGRSRTNTIPIRCEKSSRRHALIREAADGGCIVLDLGSSNGTFVNGTRITHSSPIKAGDRVEIGSEHFVLRALTSNGDTGSQTALPTPEPQQVNCWIIVGDEEAPPEDAAQAGDGDTFKTVVGWSQMCRRILDHHGASISAHDDRKLFAWWEDPQRDESVATQVAKAIGELRLFQGRRRGAFRLALHAGTVVVSSQGHRPQDPLIGTEVSFALQMQRLAWVLATPCLLSEEAGRRLSRHMKVQALEPCGLRSYSGNMRFFSC